MGVKLEANVPRSLAWFISEVAAKEGREKGRKQIYPLCQTILN